MPDNEPSSLARMTTLADRQRIAGARAIGLLEALQRGNELPEYARPLVRDVIGEWEAAMPAPAASPTVEVVA